MSSFPIGLWHFRSPNLLIFSFLLLLSFIRVINMLRIFHKLSLYFFCRIGCYIFWQCKDSTILIQFFLLLCQQTLFFIIIGRLCQSFTKTSRLKFCLMQTTSRMHFHLILHFQFKRINILITFINTIRYPKISFFTHS